MIKLAIALLGAPIELRAYLNSLIITSDNIGDIRRSLFMPWKCEWNALVRDETAKRENKTASALPMPLLECEL